MERGKSGGLLGSVVSLLKGRLPDYMRGLGKDLDEVKAARIYYHRTPCQCGFEANDTVQRCADCIDR